MDHQHPPPSPPPAEAPRRWPPTPAQKQLIGLILALAAASVAYRLVSTTGGTRTAALFVGVPTVLAVGLALTPRSRDGSAAVMLLKGSTLALLIACVALPEGLVCLIFVLPITTIISVIVGVTIDEGRRRGHRRGPTVMAVSLPLLLLSLEGVVGSPVDPADHVTRTRVVEASAAEVAAALASPPGFAADLPSFLAVGFDQPVGASGSGVDVGDTRRIEFAASRLSARPLQVLGVTGGGDVDRPSQMSLSVIESRPGRVVFVVDEDTTMLARWLDLERAVVTWEQVDATSTRVTWRLDYERRLSPSAYFGPLQRFGMDRAADHLLDTVVVEQLP